MSTTKMNLLGPTAPDEDVWDDTELIREYDRAVKNWRKTQGKEDADNLEDSGAPPPGPWREVPVGQKESKLKVEELEKNKVPEMLAVGSWIIGSTCRAIYSEDGEEYEGKIVGIKGPLCNVRFVGYGNEQQVNISSLRPSAGKPARDQQRLAAVQYHQSLNAGKMDVGDVTDCVSTISLSSSMINNCNDSVCPGRDIDETLMSNSFINPGANPLQSSTPNAKQAIKSRMQIYENMNIMKFPGNANMNLIPPPNIVKTTSSGEEVDAASAIPSAAEATIATSTTGSDSSYSINGDAADAVPEQQAPTNLTANGHWENFNNTMPQFTFPVPPLPLSFAPADGATGYDFGRGELPSLLMSWYMAGYQSGFYDAKREFENRSRSSTGKKKHP